jgi:hypothetical protein
MRGFNRNKYMRVMKKLNENRPKEYCQLGVKYSPDSPTLVISNIPCVIDITSFGSTYDTNTGGYVVEKAVTYTIEKKYIEGKTFSNGVVLRIESILGNNSTGGYYFNSITPKTSTVLNEEGYPFGTLPVLYGEYSDGAYREYINLYAIDRRLKI